MCGIVGIIRFDDERVDELALKSSLSCLRKRGPDNEAIFLHQNMGLGHSRLAILDLDPKSNQPFHDETGRYTLVFNGEIFNYLSLKEELLQAGVLFRTKSDTEVLLYLLIKEGESCLNRLNGFFAFGFYDNESRQLILARDKYGVKPLYIYKCKEYLAFASELKALVKLGIPKKVNFNTLFVYFQLTYIPAPLCILEGVEKLPQAHSLRIQRNGEENLSSYYKIEIKEIPAPYLSKKLKLESILSSAVHDRLVSDVPVGVFLSGGVDSSVISLLAKRHKPDIQSFSIGFKGNKSFDESKYAEKVAHQLDLNHHTFHLSESVVLETIENMLEYVDEPFADSSAIAMFNLCQQTKPFATVALTGDGADEVFGGYNKHLAEAKIRRSGISNTLARISHPIIQNLPESRGANMGNAFRKLKKYSSSVKLSPRDRYWNWCSFHSENEIMNLFTDSIKKSLSPEIFGNFKDQKTILIEGNDLNYLLASDIDMVLEGDMLVKADRMSMANSMELRNPFLDSRVVDFAFTLHVNDKVEKGISKKLLKDTFRPYLPSEVFNRPKRGFEVPLTNWLKKDLHFLIEKYLNEDLLEEQKIFLKGSINTLVKKLMSNQPDNSAHIIWAILNFQVWYSKFR